MSIDSHLFNRLLQRHLAILLRTLNDRHGNAEQPAFGRTIPAIMDNYTLNNEFYTDEILTLKSNKVNKTQQRAELANYRSIEPMS